MNHFRAGLTAMVWYSKELAAGECQHWIDLSDLGGKSPSEKLQELFEKSLAKATTEPPKPERFFRRVLNDLQKTGYEVLWGQTPSYNREPALEGFLNTYVSREEPYSPQEAGELLPYRRILDGLSNRIEHELTEHCEHREFLPTIRIFRVALANFIAALSMTARFNLQLAVSF